MTMNWDDAYANAPYIEQAQSYPTVWAQSAATFREACANNNNAQLDITYGPDERHKVDLFLPTGAPRGMVLFVHGGFWRAFNKDSWSHLAAALVTAGWAVAIPSYRLAPSVTLDQIGEDVGAALNKVAPLVDGPIVLVGHSAGGQLVTMLMAGVPVMPLTISRRIERVVSISGLHDLRPLLQTKMNQDFDLDSATATYLSPALTKPVTKVPLVCWVGADERPEFIRQNNLLAAAWQPFGLSCEVVVEPQRNHFDVLEGLAINTHPLFKAVVGS